MIEGSRRVVFWLDYRARISGHMLRGGLSRLRRHHIIIEGLGSVEDCSCVVVAQNASRDNGATDNSKAVQGRSIIFLYGPIGCWN